MMTFSFDSWITRNVESQPPVHSILTVVFGFICYLKCIKFKLINPDALSNETIQNDALREIIICYNLLLRGLTQMELAETRDA
jgi:hypothetical protein